MGIYKMLKSLIKEVHFELSKIKLQLVRFALINWYSIKMSKAPVNRKTNHSGFIIISDARSGSTMLKTALQGHPKIFIKGELFLQDGYKYLNGIIAKRLLTYAPEVSFDYFYYRDYSSNPLAVGFKLLSGQLYGNKSIIWERIQNDSVLKVMRLDRKNLLERYASLQTAIETEIWNIRDPNKAPTYKITIDISSLITYLREDVKNQLFLSNIFANHPVHSITYEELYSNYDNSIQGVLKFLDVPYATLKPSIIKRKSAPSLK